MKRVLLIVLVLLLLAAMGVGFFGYKMIQAPNVLVGAEAKSLTIQSGAQFSDLQALLRDGDFLRDDGSFDQVARLMKFSRPKPGHYQINADMSNRQLINLLRSGNQTPVRLTLNSVRMIPELCGKIADQIEPDSTQLVDFLKSVDGLNLFSTDAENLMSYFIPETYQVFWNISPRDLAARMKSEHDKFWQSQEREEKAHQLGLSREEVYTLASIVEKETLKRDEHPIVAGLYLNRLRRGMPLQADPTVVFANRIFGARRVLNKHLALDDPYNTYKYAGLPPGPICMPSISSIDGVLNAEDHTYLYMCARTDNSGRHAFASTLSEHNRNANRYRNWLNQRGIR